MEPLDRLRHDLGRPRQPIGRDELPFLGLSAAIVVVVAQVSDPGTPVDLALIVAAGLALTGLGLFPRVPVELFALAVLVLVGLAVGHHGHLEVSYFLVVTMTVYSAQYLGSTARAMSIAGLSCLVIWLIAAANPDSYSWPPWIAAEIFTLVLGRALHRQRDLIDQLEEAREALAAQAVTEERRRIARELHDVAGHTLAAVLLHVTGARHVLRRDLDEAERALVDAEAVGRASMDQIRATVSALRTSERGVDPPLPEADEIADLVSKYRRAGLSINSSIAPEVAELRGPVGLALHRIGREALANVARHAPANQVSLTAELDRRRGQVCLLIVDHGRHADPPDVHAGRYGLVGMRERARSLGGTLVAEPSDDGWRVEAVLPLTGSDPMEAVGS